MNNGGDGAGGSFELAIPTSRAVIVRDEDGVSIHPHVSKQEVNKDVPRGPNLCLSKADDGDDANKVQDTVDVSTLAHCLLKLLGILFLIHSLHYLPDCYL